MLRLVHPEPTGKISRPSRPRHDPHYTPAQQTRLRAVLRNLRVAYGSWSCLAEVTGYAASSLASAASHPERIKDAMAFQLARASGMTVEELLVPRLKPVPGACPMCGRKGAR